MCSVTIIAWEVAFLATEMQDVFGVMCKYTIGVTMFMFSINRLKPLYSSNFRVKMYCKINIFLP